MYRFWELLLVVAHYDLYQPEESLSSNHNLQRRGIGVPRQRLWRGCGGG